MFVPSIWFLVLLCIFLRSFSYSVFLLIERNFGLRRNEFMPLQSRVHKNLLLLAFFRDMMTEVTSPGLCWQFLAVFEVILVLDQKGLRVSGLFCVINVIRKIK